MWKLVTKIYCNKNRANEEFSHFINSKRRRNKGAVRKLRSSWGGKGINSIQHCELHYSLHLCDKKNLNFILRNLCTNPKRKKNNLCTENWMKEINVFLPFLSFIFQKNLQVKIYVDDFFYTFFHFPETSPWRSLKARTGKVLMKFYSRII